MAALVLRDNYFQTQALSIGKRQAPAMLDEQARFMRFLEKNGRLDRAIEFLPTDEAIAERKTHGLGLTTPEQSVLLAYSKMWLSDELVSSDLPEDAWIGAALHRYFPSALQQQFGSEIARHPLRREIIATHVLNSMVNRVGSTFVFQLSELTGATLSQVVRAYLLSREVFGSVEVWQRIEALDNQVADDVQAEMIMEWRRLIARATTWFLRSRRMQESTERAAQRLAPAVEVLRTRLEPEAGLLPKVLSWVQSGVPEPLAQRVGAADRLFNALDIAQAAETSGAALDVATDVHFGIGERLGLEKLRHQIDLLPADNHWQHLAKVALSGDLADLQRSIALDAVGGDAGDAKDRLASWESRNPAAFTRAKRLVAELGEAGPADLAMLSVALRELRNFV